MGILPTNLPKETKLILIYENRTMDVRLIASVFDLENQQRLTVCLNIRSHFILSSSLDRTFELFLFDS